MLFAPYQQKLMLLLDRINQPHFWVGKNKKKYANFSNFGERFLTLFPYLNLHSIHYLKWWTFGKEEDNFHNEIYFLLNLVVPSGALQVFLQGLVVGRCCPRKNNWIACIGSWLLDNKCRVQIPIQAWMFVLSQIPLKWRSWSV